MLRHSREMTIVCSPKATQHHADRVAVLPPGKKGFLPAGKSVASPPPRSRRLIGFTCARNSS